jgi:ABC-type glutathione transport system ATPase component
MTRSIAIEHTVLEPRNISLTIGTGEAVALVGMSGGGKSTF